MIHLAHQWGYTTGRWMPWAWGLAWRLARGEGRAHGPMLALAACWRSRSSPDISRSRSSPRSAPWRWRLGGSSTGRMAGLVNELGAGADRRWRVVLVLPLAAMQLYRRRSWRGSRAISAIIEYLSAFAAPPIHLVSFVAPGLSTARRSGGRSPGTRSTRCPRSIWAYLGLVPLCLAIRARSSRLARRPGVARPAVLAVVTLLLSLGPYVPGFRS